MSTTLEDALCRYPPSYPSRCESRKTCFSTCPPCPNIQPPTNGTSSVHFQVTYTRNGYVDETLTSKGIYEDTMITDFFPQPQVFALLLSAIDMLSTTRDTTTESSPLLREIVRFSWKTNLFILLINYSFDIRRERFSISICLYFGHSS